MIINIQNTQFRITTDAQQFMLQKSTVDDDGNITDNYKTLGFYPSLDGLLKDAIWKELRCPEYETLVQALAATRRLAKAFSNTFKIKVTLDTEILDVALNPGNIKKLRR